jgi:hypothetical protein
MPSNASASTSCQQSPASDADPAARWSLGRPVSPSFVRTRLNLRCGGGSDLATRVVEASRWFTGARVSRPDPAESTGPGTSGQRGLRSRRPQTQRAADRRSRPRSAPGCGEYGASGVLTSRCLLVDWEIPQSVREDLHSSGRGDAHLVERADQSDEVEVPASSTPTSGTRWSRVERGTRSDDGLGRMLDLQARIRASPTSSSS